MISSVDDTYTEYLQHVVTDGVGVDVDVVRQTLKSLGFSDRKVGSILGETAGCTTNTSTSTTTSSTGTSTSTSTTVTHTASGTLSSEIRPGEVQQASAPSSHHVHVALSSSSTSSPPTTASQSAPSAVSNGQNAADVTDGSAAPHSKVCVRVKDAEPSKETAHTTPASTSSPSASSSSSWSRLSLRAIATSQAQCVPREQCRASETDTSTSTSRRPHERNRRDDAQIASDARLARLEAMHALLLQISLIGSDDSSTSPSPHVACAESGAAVVCVNRDGACSAASSATSTATITDDEGDLPSVDSDQSSILRRYSAAPHMRVPFADAHDGALSACEQATSSPCGQPPALGSRAHRGGQWRQAAPPPLLTLVREVGTEAGDVPSRDARHVPAPAPALAAPPAFASYREDMSRWVLSRRPVTSPPLTKAGRIKHSCPPRAQRTQPRYSSRPSPSLKTAITEPHVHGISMKPSVRAYTQQHGIGKSPVSTTTLPTTLARRVRSDTVSLAAAYREAWSQQERRVRRKKDAALWETRRRLVPSD